MATLILNLLIEALFASIASVGFAMVFNVPKHTLIYCAIGGAITYMIRTIFLHLGFGIEISTFLASTFIGIIALYWSRKHLIPRPVYTVASIIPMIPSCLTSFGEDFFFFTFLRFFLLDFSEAAAKAILSSPSLPSVTRSD